MRAEEREGGGGWGEMCEKYNRGTGVVKDVDLNERE